jgi:hypothetical protein
MINIACFSLKIGSLSSKTQQNQRAGKIRISDQASKNRFPNLQGLPAPSRNK